MAPVPAAPPAVAPAPAPPPAAQPAGCHSAYVTCVAVKGDWSGRGDANDLDCPTIDKRVQLKAIGDGWGCQSYGCVSGLLHCRRVIARDFLSHARRGEFEQLPLELDRRRGRNGAPLSRSSFDTVPGAVKTAVKPRPPRTAVVAVMRRSSFTSGRAPR